jgi:hypothetical protein
MLSDSQDVHRSTLIRQGCYSQPSHSRFHIPRMANHPSRHRIKFCDVAVGQRFYDPISEEYFVKQSDGLAAMVTGPGDGTVPDEFEADDIVAIDDH